MHRNRFHILGRCQALNATVPLGLGYAIGTVLRRFLFH
jgi:hypothetical protein